MKKHRANERKAMLRRGAASRKARLIKTVREWYNGEYQREARKQHKAARRLHIAVNPFTRPKLLPLMLDVASPVSFTLR